MQKLVLHKRKDLGIYHSLYSLERHGSTLTGRKFFLEAEFPALKQGDRSANLKGRWNGATLDSIRDKVCDFFVAVVSS